jgi:hypothetical protein
MRTSTVVAAFLCIGGSVAAVAALPNPYLGSDVLFTITQQAIGASSLGLSQEADYTGGGSGNGAAAMAGTVSPYLAVNAKQQTAPMTRLVKKEGNVCSFNDNGGNPDGGAPPPGPAGQGDTSAAAIVIGLDAVDIFSSTSAGGAPACQGPDDTASNDNKDYGLVVSGTTGAFAGASPNPAQNWKWALALVYGGYDYSQTGGGPEGAPDCGQTSRLNLVANWSNLFQQAQAPGTCSNTNAACAASGPTGGALWHAFRRDDDSGTSDVFATILGLSPSVSNSSSNGFGASPYCNAINWDTTTGTTGCTGKTLPHDQWTGPGGIPDPLSTQLITGTTMPHRRPPPGVWGDAPIPSQNKFTSADVLPTQQQDNDPIRRKCLGNGVTNNVNFAGEEVCNIDGALGLVLPMVDSDFVLAMASGSGTGNLVQYPTNVSNSFAPNGGRPVNVLNCAPASAAKHSGECPNGDALNLAVCQVPIDNVHFTSQVVSGKSTVASSILTTRPPCAAGAFDVYVPGATSDAASGCLANAGHPDGRHYNVQLHDGASGLNGQNSPSYVQQTISALGTTLDYASAYNRIHQVATVLGPTASGSGVGAAAGCQYEDSSDQIGCLAQADPCSIGFGGDASKAIATTAIANPGTSTTGTPGALTNAWTGTTGALGGFDSVRAAQVYPTPATVQLLGQAGEYQLSRKIYFSTLVGFANIGATAGDPFAADELTLARFEATPNLFNPILVNGREFTLGAQFPGTPGGGTDPQFCEDFNEQTICNNTATAPANVNGCTAAAQTAANLPVGVSTICGDGIRGPYEECDNGSLETPVTGTAANPNGAGAGKGNSNSDSAPGGCSLTCRCVNDFVNGNCN